MARRVIQFPVRNAFAAQRSYDALARNAQDRDSQDHAHRIAEQVEGEIARLAERQATGNRSEFETARARSVVTLRPTSRFGRFRKRLAEICASIVKLFSRR